MQCISSFNKNSPLLTFNICIIIQLPYLVRRLALELSTQLDSSGCVELLQRLQLEINSLNGKKRKMIKPIWIRKAYFSTEMFPFCSLWLTIKCNGVFWLMVCTENTRKRLKASKNDWIRACMSFWTLPIPTGCKLKF